MNKFLYDDLESTWFLYMLEQVFMWQQLEQCDYTYLRLCDLN